jgi:hypothetical protein
VLLQPIHRNGVTLLHTLKFGLERGSIYMVELSAQHWSNKHKGKQTCQGKLPLFSSCCCKSTTRALLFASSFSCELTTWTRSSTTFL